MHHTLNLRLLAALCEVTRCLQWHSERHGVGMDAKAVEDAKAAIAEAEAIKAVDATKEIEGVRLTGLRQVYVRESEELEIWNADRVVLAGVPKFGSDFDHPDGNSPGPIQQRIADNIVALIRSATGAPA